MRNQCPVCGSYMVEAYGSKESDILLVGEFPGEAEMQQGYPFVGNTGKVLQYEMTRAGLDMWSCRLTNLWLHYQNKDQDCFQYGLRELMIEMAGRKVLFMGSELARYFLGKGVSYWYGLEAPSPLYPRSTQWVMYAPNPAICMHTQVGEFRLSVEKFVRKVKGE